MAPKVDPYVCGLLNFTYTRTTLSKIRAFVFVYLSVVVCLQLPQNPMSRARGLWTPSTVCLQLLRQRSSYRSRRLRQWVPLCNLRNNRGVENNRAKIAKSKNMTEKFETIFPILLFLKLTPANRCRKLRLKPDQLNSVRSNAAALAVLWRNL